MPELTGHMLHFAYGDDLSRAVFLKTCPGADWFGPARMEGHRLIFDAAGRASVRTDAVAVVWGALWLVPAAMLPVLDASAGEGFARTTRRIVSPAGPRTEATLYVAEIAERDEAAPTAERLHALIEAAKENKLPADYLAVLKGLGAQAKVRKDSR
ncbi:MAG: gamma-glutamylcyclotransferase family protein [Rariglobus sp.]|nr:gamma-glutamylcyclotransferase family protein [Rariglobus sp.]